MQTRINEQLTREIDVSTNIKIWHRKTPKTFHLIMNEIIKTAKGDKGYKMKSKGTKFLYSLDDAILTAGSNYDLQNQTKIDQPLVSNKQPTKF